MPNAIGRRLVPLHEDLERVRAGLHQTLPDAPTEAAAVGHEVQGLDHAGLARAVVANQQVQPGGRLEADVVKAPQAANVEAGDLHGAR